MKDNQTCFSEVPGKRVCGAVGDEFYCSGLYCICPFYKTKEQQAQSKKQAFERIASLSPQEQQYISERYFNNKMPWNTYEGKKDK